MSQHHMGQSHLNLRAQVIRTLLAVQQGQSLASILPQHLDKVPERDRGLYHELVLGSLRQWYGLKHIALPLLAKPLNNETVETCLYVGLYQLLCTRLAPHAVISETVEAVKQLGVAALSGVVNAILRRISRDLDLYQSQLATAHGLPSWLFKRLKKDWPEQIEILTHALKQAAPLTLRINTRHLSRQAYLNKLLGAGIQAHLADTARDAIVLEQTVQIPTLPGYAEGWFSVQDAHAQLCASIVGALDGKNVLDACAAPGGKTAHLLEKYRPAALTAIDQDAKRLVRVTENLQRLQLLDANVSIFAADATTWTAAQAFDCIVLDAPCSAIGVMRRHPDIRLLRQPSDIQQTVELQKQILENMWQQLKVGGELLYITCSILKAENEQQMVNFFTSHPEAKEVKIEADWGIEQLHGRQLLPQPGQGDGFFYCRIRKVA